MTKHAAIWPAAAALCTTYFTIIMKILPSFSTANSIYEVSLRKPDRLLNQQQRDEREERATHLPQGTAVTSRMGVFKIKRTPRQRDLEEAGRRANQSRVATPEIPAQAPERTPQQVLTAALNDWLYATPRRAGIDYPDMRRREDFARDLSEGTVQFDKESSVENALCVSTNRINVHPGYSNELLERGIRIVRPDANDGSSSPIVSGEPRPERYAAPMPAPSGADTGMRAAGSAAQAVFDPQITALRNALGTWAYSDGITDAEYQTRTRIATNLLNSVASADVSRVNERLQVRVGENDQLTSADLDILEASGLNIVRLTPAGGSAAQASASHTAASGSSPARRSGDDSKRSSAAEPRQVTNEARSIVAGETPGIIPTAVQPVLRPLAMVYVQALEAWSMEPNISPEEQARRSAVIRTIRALPRDGNAMDLRSIGKFSSPPPIVWNVKQVTVRPDQFPDLQPLTAAGLKVNVSDISDSQPAPTRSGDSRTT